MKIRKYKNSSRTLKRILNIRLLYFISFSLCVLFILSASFFSYKFILDTIAYTGEAMRLKEVVSPEAFNREEFDLIVKNIEEKQKIFSRYSQKSIRNIFSDNPAMENFGTLAEIKGASTSTPEILEVN